MTLNKYAVFGSGLLLDVPCAGKVTTCAGERTLFLNMFTCRLPSLSQECTKYISAYNAHEGLRQYIYIVYSNKKETSDFHGIVSFDPVKMSQPK